MEPESQVAFAWARARLSAITDAPIHAAIAWHLQSRIVEELFDLERHQPGHHAVGIPLFGGHVVWGIPSLALPRRARDERAPPHLAHGADAIATLEHLVGWPALASALREVAAASGRLDRAGVQALLESALGIPVQWALDAIDPGVRINYALARVESNQETCGSERCYRTSITVVRHGAQIFPDASSSGALSIPIALDFANATPSRLAWDGTDASKTFVVESGLPPSAITLDPDRVIQLDENWHDQQWRASPSPVRRPIKAIAAWLVWLQNAAITYGLLL